MGNSPPSMGKCPLSQLSWVWHNSCGEGWGLGMKLHHFGLFSAFLVAGCAGPDIWDKPGGSQAQFNVDQARCAMYAQGIPQQQAQQLPPSYTTTTTYVGGPYGGSALSTTQAQPNVAQGFANLATALGNAANEQAAMRNCMVANGYILRPPQR